MPDLSRKPGKSSTGGGKNARPVEEIGQKLYGWGKKCLTRRGKWAKALRVALKMPYPSRKPGETSTGGGKNARPVEKTGQKLYGWG